MFEIDGAMNAEVEVFDASFPASDELTGYMAKVLAAFEQYAKMSHHQDADGSAIASPRGAGTTRGFKARATAPAVRRCHGGS
jgi:hypothetical protein